MTSKYEISATSNYFTDTLYQFEVESKGYLSGIIVKVQEETFELTFYDLTRFEQDIGDELERESFINLSEYKDNIIFLKNLTLENILNAIELLFENTPKLHPCN